MASGQRTITQVDSKMSSVMKKKTYDSVKVKSAWVKGIIKNVKNTGQRVSEDWQHI